MAKPKKSSILMRLAPLVPDVDRIAELYGIDVAKAKVIHGMLRAVEDATKELLIAQSQIVAEQAEFIEQQAKTAKQIERQLGKERDARTILGNIEVFLSSEVASVEYVLEQVFVPIFAEAFGNLTPERQVELFSSLRVAVNSLQRRDNILEEP